MLQLPFKYSVPPLELWCASLPRHAFRARDLVILSPS